MKAAETPTHSKHGEISKADCTAVTWKLGKSVESIEEEELEKSGPSESNNNDGGQPGDSRHLQRTSSNCVRSWNFHNCHGIFRKQYFRNQLTDVSFQI